MEFLLIDYAVEHKRILSKGNPSDRWVVAMIDKGMGTCNRVMHILSCLAFAVCSRRALLFNWDEEPNRVVGVEEIAQSDFLNIFEQPSIAYSYRDALRKAGITHEKAESDGIVLRDVDTDFLLTLGSMELNKKYPQRVVYIHRWEWWAPPLFENHVYRSVLRGMQSKQFFSDGFRFLFTPKGFTSIENSTGCDWLIQIRAQWDRKTANPAMFRQCAVQHGFKTSARESFLISDQNGLNLDGFTSTTTGCRNGLECLRAGVMTMYAMSSCKNAVLTDSSTFGQCITGLGQIQNVYVVRSDGSCVQKAYVDPVDAGAISDSAVSVSSHITSGYPLTRLGVQMPWRATNTIVTAYFKIPSKHSDAEYEEWMGNMLSMQDAMVIYTSVDLVEQVTRFRQHATRQTVIIVLDLKDTWIANNQTISFWEHQLEIDPERTLHQSYQLFWVWLSKVWFVTDAIRINPFQSTLFVWSDIGCFRTTEYRSMKWLQHTEMVPDTALLMWHTHSVIDASPKRSQWVVKTADLQGVFIDGALMAGYASTWLEFEAAWRVVFMGYISRKMFVGEDQALIQSVCAQYPKLCVWLAPSEYDCFLWRCGQFSVFGLQNVFFKGW
jgi:hypothetical protein